MDIQIRHNLVRRTIEEARIAFEKGDKPFAAILADSNGNIVGCARNTVCTDSDPTAHAEINLIREFSIKNKTRDLSDYYLVSNARSCPMCFSAAIRSKIKNYIFGIDSEGHMDPNLNVLEIAKYSTQKLNIEVDVLRDECQKMLEEVRNKEILKLK